MSRTLSALVLAALLSSVAPAALAGGRTGPLASAYTEVYQGRTLFVVIFTNASTEFMPPACNTSGSFAWDLATETGREAANQARLALALGLSFSASNPIATAGCTLHPNIEDGVRAQILAACSPGCF